MKQRMKGLPQNPKSALNGMKKSFVTKKTDDIITSAMEAMMSPSQENVL
jgi:hypothetical protein